MLNATAMLSVLSDKNVIPPYGVNGGSNGAANRFTVFRKGKRIEPSHQPGKVSGFPLLRDDVVCEETSGGGGYGDPLSRDPTRVMDDFSNGYITLEQADLRYGVAITQNGVINEVKTKERREELRSKRVNVILAVANEEMFNGPRREFVLSLDVARRVGVGPGDLVEINIGRGAPLRAWVRIGEDLSLIPNSSCRRAI